MNVRKIRARLVTASLLLPLAALPAAAGETMDGKVKTVSDGDTLVVSAKGRPRVVQLAGIDAPELTQEFGAESRRFVEELTRGKRVIVEVVGTGHHDSIVGRVAIEGKDLASLLVAAGLAWATDGSPAAIQGAQQKAKSSSLGLWASASPTPPWEFRGQA